MADKIMLHALRTFDWPHGRVPIGARFASRPHPKGQATAREMADHLVARGFAEIIESPEPDTQEHDNG